MADQQQLWTFGIDATGAVSGASQLTSAIGNQNSQLQNLIVTMSKYNAQLNKFEITSQGKTPGGDNATVRTLLDPRSGRQTLKDFQITAPEPASDIFDKLGGAETLAKRVAAIQLLHTALRAVITAIEQAAQEAVKFQVAISEIRTISQDANISFNQWSDTIQSLSDKFGHSQLDVAEATYQAISNQVVKADEAFNFLNATLQLGQVTQTNATDAVNLMSSAVTSFGLRASDADNIAAGLFKTIELGRVRGSEMANTFGRIGSIAHVLGVSLEEVEAAIATLTVQGVKFSDASTFITNVLSKLAKPTGDMKELFKQMGVSSGEAAIATFGLAGTLNKIQEASKGTLSGLAEFFNEIRGLKGAAGLTLFEGFDKNLAEIKDAGESYKNATKIILESPGKQIEIELNKIKNFFVNNLGQTTLGYVAALSKSVGGLAEATKLLVTLFLEASAAMVAYKTATLAGAAATALLTAAQSTLTTKSLGGVVQTTALSRGLGNMVNFINASVVPALGIAAIAVTGIAIAMQNTGAEALRTSQYLDNLSEKLSKQHATKFLDQSTFATFDSQSKIVFDAVGQYIANALKNAERRVQTLREAVKGVGDELGIQFKTVIDNINNGIREISKNITQSQEEIKKSAKSIVDFQRQLEDDLFNEKVKFGTPLQQIQFMQERIAQLRNEAREGFLTNDKDEVASARQKFTEIAKLMSDVANKQVDLARAANPGVFIPVNLQPLKNSFQDLADFRKRLELDYQEAQKQSIRNFEQLQDKEKQRVRSLEEAVKKFLDLQNALTTGKLDKSNDHLKDFFKGDGGIDIEKLKRAFTDQANLIVGLGGPQAEQIISFYKNIFTQVDNLNQVAVAERDRFEIASTQQKFVKLREEHEKFRKELESSAKETAESLGGKGQLLDNLTDAIKQFQSAVNLNNPLYDTIRQLIPGLGSDAEGRGIAASGASAAQANKDLKEFLDLIAQLRSPNFAENLKDKTVIDAWLQKINELKLKLPQIAVDLDTYLKNRLQDDQATLGNKTIRTPEPGKAGVSFKQVLDDAGNIIDIVRAKLEALQETQAQFEKVKDAPAKIILEATGPLRKVFDDMLQGSGETQKKISSDFSNIEASITSSINKVDELTRALDNLRVKGVQLQIDTNVGMFGTGGGGDFGAGGFANGGYIYGGPRGLDNIPAWLAQGEFVMNSAATQMYRPILESMNASKRPGYYSHGGYVTTNVGDINLNVNNRSELDVRKFAHELRREIRRGNVAL